MVFDYKAWRAEWRKNNKDKLNKYKRDNRARKRERLLAEGKVKPRGRTPIYTEAELKERRRARAHAYYMRNRETLKKRKQNTDRASARRRVHRIFGGNSTALAKTPEYEALVLAYTSLALIKKELKNAERQ